MRLFFIAALACAETIVFSSIASHAGTTSEIQGVATDSIFHPIVGVRVSAVAPSGHASTITEVNGFYSLIGLPLDTYTVTFSKDGYVTKSIPGVTTVQDQSIRVNAQLETVAKTLAHVTVRNSTSLVQPIVTANVYVFKQSRFDEIMGSPQDPNGYPAFSTLPGVIVDTQGIPTIRAGASNDVGYSYDGLDNTDPIFRSNINAVSLNGISSVQLSTGGYDVSVGNTNSGVINQVIRRGTYPAQGRATIRLTSPAFGHELSFDFGSASPDNRLSYYISFGGHLDASDYGDRKTILPLRLGSIDFTAANDEVLNLYYHFGRGDKNVLQFLSNLSGTTASVNYLIDPSLAPYASNNGNVQSANDPFGLGPQPNGHPSTFQSDYTTLFPGQVAYRQNTGYGNTGTFNSVIDKLNFKRQFTPSSFAEGRLYRISENFVGHLAYASGSFSDNYQDFQTTGLGEAFDYANQLNSRHEASFGGDSVYYKNRFFGGTPSLEPIFQPLEDLGCPQIAAAINAGVLTPGGSFGSTPGIGGCYNAPFNNALNFAVPGLGLPTDAAHAPLSTYVSDFTNIGDPLYRYDLWVKDRYQPTERLTLTLGLRWDAEHIPLPADAALQNTTYYIDDSGNVVTVPGQPIGNDVTRPQQISPRLAASYQLTPRDTGRFSFGKNIEFAPLFAIERAFQVPGYLQNCNIANGCFLPLPGFGKTNFVTNLYQQVVLDLTTHQNAQYTPVLPQTAVNYDFSIEHDFGHGLELRITPYYRKGFNYVVGTQPLLFTLPSGTPVFGPSKQINAGINENTGVEFALQRNAQYGFSGLFDLTYDNTLANNDGDNFPTVNAAVLAANRFFHVTYVPPLVGTLNLVYNAHSPWHASTTVAFESGYRYGVGKRTYVFVSGAPTSVLNTDLATTSSQAYYFTDPTNPGTLLHPNIIASRGTPEGDDPGTMFTPAAALVNVTLSRSIDRENHTEVGVRVQNLFGNYTPTVIPPNVYYVPQGVGGFGPGSGVNTNACAPGQTFGCEPFRYNQSPYPYENEPSGPPRVFTFFISAKY